MQFRSTSIRNRLQKNWFSKYFGASNARQNNRARSAFKLVPCFFAMIMFLRLCTSQHKDIVSTNSAVARATTATDTTTTAYESSSSHKTDEKYYSEFLKFPTLHNALEHSQVVALYFAASWCRMSTPITELIDEYLKPTLIETDSYANDYSSSNTTSSTASQLRKLSVVYVSSDTTESQFSLYTKDRYWTSVPFAPNDERQNLKRHFKVCAKKELGQLGIERDYEIPTLIILSGTTHQVATMNGVKDIRRHGRTVLDYWFHLVQEGEYEIQ